MATSIISSPRLGAYEATSGEKQTTLQHSIGDLTVIDSITLPSGLWLILASARFDSNAQGSRGVSISSPNSTSPSNPHFVNVYAASQGSTSLQVCRLNSGGGTYSLLARQGSGSELNVHSRMWAIPL